MGNGSCFPCGTAHCHGGTYALMRCDFTKRSSSIDFNDGAHKLAQDLGFNDASELHIWIAENPEIWGNQYGYSLFGSTPYAFTTKDRPDGARSICDIAKHWTEVADRLQLLELSNED